MIVPSVAGGCTRFSRFSSSLLCFSCGFTTPDKEIHDGRDLRRIFRSHTGPVDRQPEQQNSEECCDEGDGS